MKNKVIIILTLMFLSSTIISCCDCADPVTYEKVYNAVEITPYDLSGFSPMVATESVYRNAFGLTLSVNAENKIYAQKVNLGFNSALALQACDCVGDKYIYSDPISNIKIYMKDQLEGQQTDVSDLFRIYSYSNELISLEEFMKERKEWHDGFQIELVNHDSLPNAVIFIAEVILESGNSILNQTEFVNFIDD